MDTLAGQPVAAARRVHARAAAVPGLGPDLVPERDRGERAAARADRPALAGPLPRERRGLEHARVPEGVRAARRARRWCARTPAGCGRRSAMALHRSRRNRMIAGVCGGLAEALGWDLTLVRLLYVLVSVLLRGVPGDPRVPRALGRRPRVAGRLGRRASAWPSTASSIAGTPPATGWRRVPGRRRLRGQGRTLRQARQRLRAALARMVEDPVRDRLRRGRPPAAARARRCWSRTGRRGGASSARPSCADLASSQGAGRPARAEAQHQGRRRPARPLAAEAGPPEEAARRAPDAGAARGRGGAAAPAARGSSAGASGPRKRWTIPWSSAASPGAAWPRRWSAAG